MTEEEITEATVKFLESNHWQVISVHYPGSHSGMTFHRSDREGPGAKGAVLVDIVACKGRLRLLVESKPRFSVSDAKKLRELLSTPAYYPSMHNQLSLPARWKPYVFKALAFSDNIPTRAKEISGFIYFVVRSNKVRVVGTLNEKQGQRLFGEYQKL